MSARAKAIAPLAIVIGVLSFLWCQLALNFQFHWVTDGDLGNGLELPANFQLIVWPAFISWGLFFAAGGDNAAFGKIFLAVVFGTLAALVTFALAGKIAEFPDFYGISLMVGIMALVLVLILIAGDWYYVAGTFPCFAACFGVWVATGLDNWIPNGGGIGNSVEALDPTAGTAGFGAAGGVLSQPWGWVWFSTFITLVCGVILGIVSAKITAAVTPKPKAAAAEA